MSEELERHSDQLEWLMESWRSIELVTTHRLRRMDAADKPADFDQIREHYIETARGQRYSEQRMSNEGHYRGRHVRFFDGERGINVVYKRDDPEKQNQASTHRHFGNERESLFNDRPVPLSEFWVNRIPLSEAIRTGKLLGDRTILGRECHVVQVDSRVGRHVPSWIYVLDKATSIPLAVEYYGNPRDREAKRPLKSWTAKAIENMEGYPLVVESTQQDFSGPNRELKLSRSFRVESVAFNRDFPDSRFVPELQDGIPVYNETTNRFQYQSKVTEAAEGATTSTSTPPTVPIRADAPEPSNLLSVAGLVVGVVALSTYAFFRWRRTN